MIITGTLNKHYNNGLPSSGMTSPFFLKLNADGYPQWIQEPFKSNNSHIKIFPNPTRKYIHVITSESLNGSVLELYNSNGMIVKKQLINNTKLIVDVSNLTSGIYFYTVKSKNGSMIKDKLLVN